MSRERRFFDGLREILLAEARREAPREGCGLIELDRRGFTLLACRNAAEEPETTFLVDPADQLEAMAGIEARGTELFALWHSHPHEGAEPSERDRAFAAGVPELAWWITGLEPESHWLGFPAERRQPPEIQ
jgi:proteasome lid subunit RPN8/RPN11